MSSLPRRSSRPRGRYPKQRGAVAAAAMPSRLRCTQVLRPSQGWSKAPLLCRLSPTPQSRRVTLRRAQALKGRRAESRETGTAKRLPSLRARPAAPCSTSTSRNGSRHAGRRGALHALHDRDRLAGGLRPHTRSERLRTRADLRRQGLLPPNCPETLRPNCSASSDAHDHQRGPSQLPQREVLGRPRRALLRSRVYRFALVAAQPNRRRCFNGRATKLACAAALPRRRSRRQRRRSGQSPVPRGKPRRP